MRLDNLSEGACSLVTVGSVGAEYQFRKSYQMANTYAQILIHAVFTVQNVHSLIRDAWKDELYKYITGILRNHGHRLHAINGMPDHVHLFFALRPTQSLSDAMQDVKGDSSRWINQRSFTDDKFSWQEGYGAFSYNRSAMPAVIRHIQEQDLLHRRKTFLEEYREMLQAFDLDFDERYIFHAVPY